MNQITTFIHLEPGFETTIAPTTSMAPFNDDCIAGTHNCADEATCLQVHDRLHCTSTIVLIFRVLNHLDIYVSVHLVRSAMDSK